MSELAIKGRMYERSFSFCTGRLNVIMGPNGSGKTTLLNALALRSMARFKGEIRREGHAEPRDIAYLPQGIWDIDDIALDGFLHLCRRGQVRPGPVMHLKRYSQYVPRNLDNLSGGERRLLLFLAVAAQRQKIHVYDEPFQFLDDIRRELVTAMLLELVKDGRLVIVVAHAKEMPEGFCSTECPFYLD